MIFNLVQPAVKRGSSNTEIPGDLPSGNLESFHMPEDEKPFMNSVSWALALLAEVFLKDRQLHFELVDPVFEEEDLLGFGVGIPAGQLFEASLANPPRESGRKQSSLDDERDGGTDDVEVLYHGALSKLSGAVGANSQGIIASDRGQNASPESSGHKCLLFKGIGSYPEWSHWRLTGTLSHNTEENGVWATCNACFYLYWLISFSLRNA